MVKLRYKMTWGKTYILHKVREYFNYDHLHYFLLLSVIILCLPLYIQAEIPHWNDASQLIVMEKNCTEERRLTPIVRRRVMSHLNITDSKPVWLFIRAYNCDRILWHWRNFRKCVTGCGRTCADKRAVSKCLLLACVISIFKHSKQGLDGHYASCVSNITQ